MRNVEQQYDPIVLAAINMLGAASIIGVLLCVAAFLHDRMGNGAELGVYFIWFSVSAVSAHLMRQGDRWGAYALVLVTVLVGLYDLARGIATLGGAMLALLVITIVIAYLQQGNWLDQEDRVAS
jgi:hypothetical protein